MGCTRKPVSLRVGRRAGDALAHRGRFLASAPPRRRCRGARRRAPSCARGRARGSSAPRARRRRPASSSGERSTAKRLGRPSAASKPARIGLVRPRGQVVRRPAAAARHRRAAPASRTRRGCSRRPTSGVRKAAMPASARSRRDWSACGTRKAATGLGLPAARAASRASRMPATESPGRNCAEEPMTARARSVSSAASSAPSAAATRSGLVPARVTSSSRAPWCGKPAASSAAPAAASGRARLDAGDAEAVHRHGAAAAGRRHHADGATRPRQGRAAGEQRRQLQQPFEGRTRGDAEPRKKASAAASVPASAPVWLAASSAP